jgi:uncharacterized protein YbaR (Trm112 family)
MSSERRRKDRVAKMNMQRRRGEASVPGSSASPPLTKLEERKLRNRMSAIASRKRKTDLQLSLSRQVDLLHQEKTALVAENAALRYFISASCPELLGSEAANCNTLPPSLHPNLSHIAL